MIMVGHGALGACDDIETMADLLGAPVVKSLLGKAVIPDDSPYTTGGLGLLGTLPSEKAMEDVIHCCSSAPTFLTWRTCRSRARRKRSRLIATRHVSGCVTPSMSA